MPWFFDGKCWKLRCLWFLSFWMSAIYESQKDRKWFATNLYYPTLAKIVSGKPPFHRVQRYTYFANLASILWKFGFCEELTRSAKRRKQPKYSKWGSCWNPIFRKWFCINKSKIASFSEPIRPLSSPVPFSSPAVYTLSGHSTQCRADKCSPSLHGEPRF